MAGKPKRFDAVLRVRVRKPLHRRFMRLADQKGTYVADLLREVLVEAADRLEAIDAQRTGKVKV